jgi:hypothetical protein
LKLKSVVFPLLLIDRLYQGQGLDEIIAMLAEALKAGGRFKSFGLTVITHQC